MTDMVKQLRELAAEHYEMLNDIHLPLNAAAERIEELQRDLLSIEAAALERAAKVAEETVLLYPNPIVSLQIAAAIRALKQKP